MENCRTTDKVSDNFQLSLNDDIQEPSDVAQQWTKQFFSVTPVIILVTLSTP